MLLIKKKEFRVIKQMFPTFRFIPIISPHCNSIRGLWAAIYALYSLQQRRCRESETLKIRVKCLRVSDLHHT